MEILNKITVKDIAGIPSKVESEILLCQVYGVVRDVKIKDSSYGEYVRFSGSFVGVDLATGVTYKSNALILPKIGQETLVEGLENMEDKSGGLEFGFLISVVPGVERPGKMTQKYEYRLSHLLNMEQEQSDLERISAKLPRAILEHKKPKAVQETA